MSTKPLTVTPGTFRAIETRYFGPTNSRGSRVKAQAGDSPSIFLDWDDALSSDENHARAAKAFCERHNWRGHWIGGGMKSGRHVFVCMED